MASLWLLHVDAPFSSSINMFIEKVRRVQNPLVWNPPIMNFASVKCCILHGTPMILPQGWTKELGIKPCGPVAINCETTLVQPLYQLVKILPRGWIKVMKVVTIWKLHARRMICKTNYFFGVFLKQYMFLHLHLVSPLDWGSSTSKCPWLWPWVGTYFGTPHSFGVTLHITLLD